MWSSESPFILEPDPVDSSSIGVPTIGYEAYGMDGPHVIAMVWWILVLLKKKLFPE